LLGLVMLVVGGTWWAHRHLTRLVVGAVNRAYPGLQLSAKTVAFTSVGQLDLKAVHLRARHDGLEAVSIPSAQVRFSWPELRRQTIREIIIEQPSLRVNDALLTALELNGNESVASASGVPWRVEKLTIKGGTARLEFAGLPTARFGFTLQFAEEAPAQNQVAISALRVRAPGAEDDALTIPFLKLSASLDDLRHGKIRGLVVASPKVLITDALLAALPKQPANHAAEPAWSVEQLSVRDGSIHLALASWPLVDCVFSAQAQNPLTDGGAEVVLTAIHVGMGREEADALSVARARLAVTADGLRHRTIQEVEIDDPQVKVSDQLLVWRPPQMEAAASAGEEPPWQLQRLAIKRGHARVDLAGAPLAEFGFGLHLEKATPLADAAAELQSAEVLDLALRTREPGVEPFLRIPAIRAEFRLPELLKQQRLARVSVEHLDFRYGTPFRELIASGAKPALPAKPASAEPTTPYTIGELRLSDGRIHLDDLGFGVPGIECRVQTTFRELALAADAGAGGHELQTIELSQIALRSPLDPFFTVLELDSIFVRFTLAGLWKREIDEVAIVRPTLAIGPDLFWYVDRMQQNQAVPNAPPAIADDGPPWSVRTFSATSGQLVLALEGQSRVALPMPFESHAESLNFRRLSDLRLKLNIEMPEQDYDYPGYELALRGVSGRIEFSLPMRRSSNNVVNTLRLRDVRWKNFRGRDVFLDVTYDERGVFGNLSGKGYTGLLRGQFNFLLADNSPWNGWVSGTHVDLGAVTQVLAPEKFSLTGPADFRLTVTALGPDIQSVRGDYRARAKGTMRIGKLDDIIRELPGDWTSVKRALSRISLETLRDFTYDTAHGDFNFTGLTGAVHLDLRGPAGSRKIEMNFREEIPAPARRVATSQP
jgi:hypothetical protein